MSAVTVVALKSFLFDGRYVSAGEAVRMRAVDASIRGRQGLVSLDPQTRAWYRRADMVAAPIDAPVIAVVAAVEPEPEVEPVTAPIATPRRRRARRKAA